MDENLNRRYSIISLASSFLGNCRQRHPQSPTSSIIDSGNTATANSTLHHSSTQTDTFRNRPIFASSSLLQSARSPSNTDESRSSVSLKTFGSTLPRILLLVGQNGRQIFLPTSTAPPKSIRIPTPEISIPAQLIDAIAFDRVPEIVDILNSPVKTVYLNFQGPRYPPRGQIGCGRKHTYLSFASMKAANTEILRLLLHASASFGIHPDEQASPDGLTPAYLACCWGHLEALRVLREAGSEIDPHISKDNKHNNNRQYGVGSNGNCLGNSSSLGGSSSSNTVSSDQLAIPNFKEDYQPALNLFTPLMAASNFGHLHIVKQLLEWGVRVSFPTTVSSALALALNKGHLSVVDALAKSKSVDWKIEIKSAIAHGATQFARHFYILSKRYGSEPNENIPPQTPISPTISFIKDKSLREELRHLTSLGFLTECPICFDHVGTRESEDKGIIGKRTLDGANLMGNIVIHSCGRLFCEYCLDEMAGSNNKGTVTCPICRNGMNFYGKDGGTCLRLSAIHRAMFEGYLM